MYWTRPEGEARSGAHVRPPSGTMEASPAAEVASASPSASGVSTTTTETTTTESSSAPAVASCPASVS